MGLAGNPSSVTIDGKVAYFDECWKGIIESFREMAGLYEERLHFI
jgi:hypothetical protein